MRASKIAATLWLGITPACLASTVMPREERAAPAAAPLVEWRSAERADLLGYFEAETIEGEAAASLWKVYYHFAEDQSYTGAALVRPPDAPPQFQTLSGQWQLEAGGLVLDGADPVQALAGEGRLKLVAPGGSLLLRRATP